MSAVKATADPSESDAIFRRHSQRGGGFLLSEWRDAFVDLHEVVTEAARDPGKSQKFSQWLDVGGSTFLETEDILGVLTPLYSIAGDHEIRSWIERYPGSKRVLLLIPRVAQKYFPAADFRLEVRTDPEGIDDQRLGVYIRTELDPAEAVERLTKLDAAWGDRFQALTDGDVLVNVEAKS